MNAIRVAVVNWSGLPDDDVLDGIKALQRQLDEDFAPRWGIDATLVPWRGRIEGPGYWGLVLLNGHTPKSAGDAYDALSVYGHITSDGHPLARVFVDKLGPRQPWTHLASHELLEMLVDPYRYAAVYREDGEPYRMYARRVCDPCAAYSDGYDLNGHIVSDFVCPAWFGGLVPDERKDERGKIHQAFELLIGGSIGVVDPSTSKWEVLHSDGSVGPPPVEPPGGTLGFVDKLGWGP